MLINSPLFEIRCCDILEAVLNFINLYHTIL